MIEYWAKFEAALLHDKLLESVHAGAAQQEGGAAPHQRPCTGQPDVQVGVVHHVMECFHLPGAAPHAHCDADPDSGSSLSALAAEYM